MTFFKIHFKPYIIEAESPEAAEQNYDSYNLEINFIEEIQNNE